MFTHKLSFHRGMRKITVNNCPIWKLIMSCVNMNHNKLNKPEKSD